MTEARRWWTRRATVITAAVAGIAAIALLVALSIGDDENDSPGADAGGVASTSVDPGPAADESVSTPPPTADPGSPIDEDQESRSTVATGEMSVAEPVGFDATADFQNGLTARVVGIEAVDGEARTEGEVAGPALRISVEISNDSTSTKRLASQVEVASGADQAPAMLLPGPGAQSLPLELGPGERATGVVVYGVPVDQRNQVRVLVSVGVDAPVVVFEGPVG